MVTHKESVMPGQGQVGGQVHGTETGQRHETVYYIKKHGQCQREQERGEEVARKDEGRIRIDHNGKDRSYHTDGCGADKEGTKRELRQSSLKRKKDRSGKANRRMSTRPLTVPGIRRVWVKRASVPTERKPRYRRTIRQRRGEGG